MARLNFRPVMHHQGADRSHSPRLKNRSTGIETAIYTGEPRGMLERRPCTRTGPRFPT